MRISRPVQSQAGRPALPTPLKAMVAYDQRRFSQRRSATSTDTSLLKQRQNLFVEEFEPARQHLGVGGIRIDIERYQFRH